MRSKVVYTVITVDISQFISK